MARVLISMTDEFLGTIDEIAEKEQRSRSELIREALRTYMYKTRRTRDLAYDARNASILELLL
ncbi:MAG: hypothetical protein A2287_06775 [Candidatus Melainabacteria bacterium RIFOXYA12_FULL_32_12]|nr:MAG: hypothetical protein A2255_01530 [Candidatus Melainabacteria bacterium RIFOXYA2_FULL_32_9]OGI25818.1 MAG: hypothetical protein A2287_06775 [Candidatus Melainabacteria bacterium RIFOXYA12_FULL_32_12]